MDNQPNNRFDGMYLTRLLFRHRLFITIMLALSAAVSVTIALLMPNWYSATVNAVPPQSSTSGLESAMGNISSALRDIGISKLGGGGSDSYTLRVILESRSVKDSIITKYELRKAYKLEDEYYEVVLKEFERNLGISYEKDGNYFVTITDKDPKKAADMANEYLRIANHFASELNKKEQTFNRTYMEYRIASVDSMIQYNSEQLAQLTESSLMFSPEEQARAVSSALIDLKAQVYQGEIEYDLLKTVYGAEDAMTMMKKNILDNTRKKLDEAMKKPGFAGNFPLKESGKIGIEYVKLFTELEALAKAKSFLLPMYEKMKLDERKNLLTLIVLDEAVPPTKKSKPKRSFIVLGSVFGTFVLTVLSIIVIYSYRDFRKKYDTISK